MTVIEDVIRRAVTCNRPTTAAAVAVVGVDGEVCSAIAAGTGRRFADDRFTEIPDPQPATVNLVFDLASVTKLFTAATLLVALDARGLRDSARVADVLPEFRAGPARFSTFADLLRHTGGWAAVWPDHRPDAGALARFRRGTPTDPVGAVYRYSCVGYIWAGLAVEALTGTRLDVAVTRSILDPLGMGDTRFAPPESVRDGIAATEYQRTPPRGLVQGEVHDETAWALGGIVGNAGLFGTATDVFRFAELLRGRGEVAGRRVLPEWVASAMSTDRLPAGALRDRPDYGQALGPRVADRAWMGSLAAQGAVGHTGFTGTSVLAVPGGRHSVVFLTNRVHPSRNGTDMRALRSRVADEAAKL